MKEVVLKHTVAKTRDPKTYLQYGDEVSNPSGVCVFIDNGSDWLAVAHLDTVKWNKPQVTKDRIICPQLDDRLGVAIILEVLPELTGSTPDILLTDCEEKGDSTARHFTAAKPYNFAIEFDRMGSDAVFYHYFGDSLSQSFDDCGWDTNYGSYSDVADLDVGCQAVNLGCGYHLQHTDKCYARFCEVESQLARFGIWFRHYGDRDFPYTPKPVYSFDYDYEARRYGYKSLKNMAQVEGVNKGTARDMLDSAWRDSWADYSLREDDRLS